MKTIDTKQFGLPAKTILEQVDQQTLALIVDRKSRIIMADGRKILSKVDKIQQIQPHTAVVLKTSAPVCSKTRALLAEAGVEVIGLKTGR